VAAAPYLTPDEVRAAAPNVLGDDAQYDDDTLAGYVAEFEQTAEQYRGVAFTPRDCTEVLEVDWGSARLSLSWPKVRAVTSLTIDGVTVSPSSYRAGAFPWIDSAGGFTIAGGYRSGLATVVYSHGYNAPVATDPIGGKVIAACVEYVKSVARARPQRVGREVIATGNVADGSFTRLSTPDWKAGRPTGWLEVDRLLNELPDHRYPVFM
jgi:hypothetical protein